jgi:L-fuculose-phosphate aldolase
LSSLDSLKEQVARSIVTLYEMGFVLDFEGNVSVRAPDPDKFVITPSQVPRATIKSSDVLVVNGQGDVLEGDRNPSVETQLHLQVYSKRPEVNAVMHFHSPHATALAALHETIPPFLDELIPFLGPNVPTADYGMAGTEELANSVSAALAERNAVLLANHGAVVCGRDLSDALHKAKLLEKAATVYILAKSVGTPKMLPDETVEIAKEIYKTMLV